MTRAAAADPQLYAALADAFCDYVLTHPNSRETPSAVVDHMARYLQRRGYRLTRTDTPGEHPACTSL